MDDKRLLAQLKKRHRGALEQAIDRYTSYVSTVVWRAMGPSAQREDVEEVVSDVFLALWVNVDELENLKGWLGTVARNKAIDRSRRHTQTVPLLESDADPAQGPEEQAEMQEWAERLWRAVDSLEEPDRTLFLRYYYEGSKLKDAARELGLNQSTARTRLRRGKEKLRLLLSERGTL